MSTFSQFVLLLAGLSIICWLSFAWAIVWHFHRSTAPSPLMRLVAVLGTVFGIWQAATIAALDAISLPAALSGVCLYVMSLALFWWAVSATKAHRLSLAFASAQSSRIIVHGPYRWIRHPFYASYLLYWLAGVLTSWQWELLLTVILMGGLYGKAAVREERAFLLGDQAETYRHYMARTGRLFPKVLRARNSFSEAFVR